MNFFATFSLASLITLHCTLASSAEKESVNDENSKASRNFETSPSNNSTCKSSEISPKLVCSTLPSEESTSNISPTKSVAVKQTNTPISGRILAPSKAPRYPGFPCETFDFDCKSGTDIYSQFSLSPPPTKTISSIKWTDNHPDCHVFVDSKYVKKQRIFIERVHILRRSSEKMLTYEVEPLGTRKISIPEIPIDDIISISLEEVRKDYYKNDFELFLENLPFEFGIGTCEKNQINISHDEIDHDPRFGPWYAFTSHAFKLEKNLSDRNWKIILDFSITKKSSSWPLDVPLLKLIVLPSHISPRDERLTRFIPSDFCWEDVDQNTVTITDSSSTSTNQNQCINGPEALGQDFVPQEFTDLFNTDSLEIEDGEKPTIQTGFSKKLSRSPTIPDNLETMGSSSDVCDQEKPENSTESSSTIISKANDRVPNQVIPKKVRFAPILETFFPEIPDSSTSSASHTDNSELQVSPSGARKVSSSNTLDTPPSSTLEKLPSKAGQELSSVVEASPFTIVEASKNLATTTSSSSDEKDQASVPKSVSRENLSPCAIDRLESPLIFVGNASTIEKNPGHSSKSSREELSNLALLMEAQVNQVSIYDCSLSEGCEEFFSGAFNSVESDGTTGSPSAVRSSSGENGIEIKLSNLTL